MLPCGFSMIAPPPPAYVQGMNFVVARRSVCIMAGLFLVACITTFVAATVLATSYILASLLLLIALLWLVAAANAPSSGITWTGDLGAALIMVGGLTVTFELLIRLCLAESFGGQPFAFDFGLKCPAGITPCTSRNVAFTPEFNSFGHCVQGTLSLLLFPAVERASLRAGAAVSQSRILTLVRSASCFVVVYPTYNITKRALKSADSFAASSFSNNGAEWGLGFVLGLSCGVLATTLLDAVPPSTVIESLQRTSPVLMVRLLCGGLLCLLALAIAILYGSSWNNTAARSESEDAVDLAMTITFVAVAMLPIIGAIFLSSKPNAAPAETAHSIDGTHTDGPGGDYPSAGVPTSQV